MGSRIQMSNRLYERSQRRDWKEDQPCRDFSPQTTEQGCVQRASLLDLADARALDTGQTNVGPLPGDTSEAKPGLKKMHFGKIKAN